MSSIARRRWRIVLLIVWIAATLHMVSCNKDFFKWYYDRGTPTPEPEPAAPMGEPGVPPESEPPPQPPPVVAQTPLPGIVSVTFCIGHVEQDHVECDFPAVDSFTPGSGEIFATCKLEAPAPPIVDVQWVHNNQKGGKLTVPVDEDSGEVWVRCPPPCAPGTHELLIYLRDAEPVGYSFSVE
jgi:hypothetical protein